MTMKLFIILTTLLACEASRIRKKTPLSAHYGGYVERRKRVFRVNTEFDNTFAINKSKSEAINSAKQIRSEGAAKSKDGDKFTCEPCRGFPQPEMLESNIFEGYINRRKNVFRTNLEEVMNLHWRDGSTNEDSSKN